MTDTRNKRSSALSVGRPFVPRFPTPDGTISESDRKHVTYSYDGIEASEPGAGDDAILVLRDPDARLGPPLERIKGRWT